MEEEERISEIENRLEQLKNEKQRLRKKIKIKKNKEKRRLRLNNDKSSDLIRVSTDFIKAIDYINNQREENGFDALSKPKITQLIVRHKFCWSKIQEDISRFNSEMDDEDEEINE